MAAREFASFLDEVAARLGLRAAGYQRVKKTVEKRVSRRLRELGLHGLAGYRTYLADHPAEWDYLDAACRITISRFGRDAAVFAALLGVYLPERAAAASAAGQAGLRAWSAGCASGEEAYSLSIAWQLDLAPRHPGLSLAIIGTDLEPRVLARAERAVYPWGTLRELPEALRRHAFVPEAMPSGQWALLPRFRAGVRFECADLRRVGPSGPFDLILCRNSAFTYFDPANQRRVAAALEACTRPGSLVVLGAGERLPDSATGFCLREPAIYSRVATAGAPAPFASA